VDGGNLLLRLHFSNPFFRFFFSFRPELTISPPPCRQVVFLKVNVLGRIWTPWLTVEAEENQATEVGRVTPCAPFRGRPCPGGARGATRPTCSPGSPMESQSPNHDERMRPMSLDASRLAVLRSAALSLLRSLRRNLLRNPTAHAVGRPLTPRRGFPNRTSPCRTLRCTLGLAHAGRSNGKTTHGFAGPADRGFEQ
jgi:hypothetical protein